MKFDDVQIPCGDEQCGRSGANFFALDALRGLLAVYVVAGHARWLLWTGHAAWKSQPHSIAGNAVAYASAALRYGHEAVMVFFALSGFFIHLRAAKQMTREPQASFDVRDYAHRRIVRILPPYYLALTVTVVLDIIGRSLFPAIYYSQSGDALIDQVFTGKVYESTAVIPALLGIPTACGQGFGSNGPLWSIGYEIVYYGLYPVWFLIRRYGGVLAAFSAAPVLAWLLALFLLHGYTEAIMRHYPIWLAGAACAELSTRCRFDLRFSGLAGIVLTSIAATGLVTGEAMLIHLPLGVAVLLLFATIPENCNGWYSIRAFRWLGLRSYTLYAVHFPLLVLFSAVLFHLYGARPQHGWAAFGGACMATSFGVLCFEVCERHFINRGMARSVSVKENAGVR